VKVEGKIPQGMEIFWGIELPLFGTSRGTTIYPSRAYGEEE